MNIEQLEAATESLVRYNEESNKANGWIVGRPIESRRIRIKRLRRWRRLQAHYPDRFEREDFKCVSKKDCGRFEVMVTSFRRKDYSYLMSIPESIPTPDYKDWPDITQFNGYCRFRSKPVIERGYHGILSYVPVHGGITYANHDRLVSVYGFDTAHANDEQNPLVKNIEWVEYQAWLMGKSIALASLYELDYLRSECPYFRARIIDKYHAKIRKLTSQPFVIGNNFAAMINLMCGRL